MKKACMLLFCMGILFSCSKPCTCNQVSEIDQRQYTQILNYIRKDSAMFEYAELIEKKRPAEIELKVAYREGGYSGLILHFLLREEVIQYLDMSAEELEQADRDSIKAHNEKQNQNIPLIHFNHGWPKLSQDVNPKYIIFFTRYKDRLVEASIYSRDDIEYDDEGIYFMGAALNYHFYYDKTTEKMVKVRVSESHA